VPTTIGWWLPPIDGLFRDGLPRQKWYKLYILYIYICIFIIFMIWYHIWYLIHVFFLSMLYGIWATRFVGTCTSLAASMAPVASTTSMSWTWKRGAARGWGPGNPQDTS
jgi:hypothetical protein